MTSLKTLCLSALLLGATATIPALAQDANAQPGARDNARTLGQAPDQGMSPGMAMNKSTMSKSRATKRSMGMKGGMGANDTGMNGNASMNANMSGGAAMGSDTSKKYVRSHRAADFASEQEMTKQLNQQNGVTTTAGTTTR